MAAPCGPPGPRPVLATGPVGVLTREIHNTAPAPSRIGRPAVHTAVTPRLPAALRYSSHQPDLSVPHPTLACCLNCAAARPPIAISHTSSPFCRQHRSLCATSSACAAGTAFSLRLPADLRYSSHQPAFSMLHLPSACCLTFAAAGHPLLFHTQTRRSAHDSALLMPHRPPAPPEPQSLYAFPLPCDTHPTSAPCCRRHCSLRATSSTCPTARPPIASSHASPRSADCTALPVSHRPPACLPTLILPLGHRAELFRLRCCCTALAALNLTSAPPSPLCIVLDLGAAPNYFVFLASAPPSSLCFVCLQPGRRAVRKDRDCR